MRPGALLVIATGCGRIGFAPSGDGSLDGVAPVCNARFCDGFEDPALSAWTGVLVENGSSANRVDSFGYRGASLRSSAPGGSTLAGRYVDAFPPPLPAEEWVRVYTYSPSGSVLDLEAVEIGNAGRNSRFVLSLYDDSSDIHSHGIAGSFNRTDPNPPPRDRWVCYELRVMIGAAGAVELYRDGALVLAEPSIDTRAATDLARVFVGITSKPQSGDAAIHIDEVVADTKRPGC